MWPFSRRSKRLIASVSTSCGTTMRQSKRSKITMANLARLKGFVVVGLEVAPPIRSISCVHRFSSSQTCDLSFLFFIIISWFKKVLSPKPSIFRWIFNITVFVTLCLSHISFLLYLFGWFSSTCFFSRPTNSKKWYNKHFCNQKYFLLFSTFLIHCSRTFLNFSTFVQQKRLVFLFNSRRGFLQEAAQLLLKRCNVANAKRTQIASKDLNALREANGRDNGEVKRFFFFFLNYFLWTFKGPTNF